MSKAGLIILAIGVLLIIVLYSMVCKISPKDRTWTRIIRTEVRIRKYVRVHNRFPADLSALPPWADNRDDSFVDGWGRPIKYEINTDTMVTLSSLGKDGVAGGVDLNSDIVVVLDVSEDSPTLYPGRSEDSHK